MKWTKTAAYQVGVIDENGKRLKPDLNTKEERESYTMFHKLAFNIKRLMERAPGTIGKNIATYATALFLLREEYSLSEESLNIIVEHLDMDTVQLFEDITYIDSAADIVGSFNGLMISRESVEDLLEDIGGDIATVDTTKIAGHTFVVPNNVFRKFQMGRNKYERWSKYLETEDSEQMKIKRYAQKYPNNVVLLQCDQTGAMRAIRKKSCNML